MIRSGFSGHYAKDPSMKFPFMINGCLLRASNVIDIYELTLQNNGNGTVSAEPLSGLSGHTSTLTAEANEGYSFSGYSVTGATIDDNVLTFEQRDCTAKAWFEPITYNLSLENDGHGTVSASKLTGHINDDVALSNTPDDGYDFSGYAVTGAIVEGNTLTFSSSDATAKAMFSPKVLTLTLQNDGHGTVTATKVTGHVGDTVTLTPTYNDYYRFSGYQVTGGSINGNTYTFGTATNQTAKANFSANKFTVTGTFPFTAFYSTTTALGAFTGKIGGITGSIPNSWGTVGNAFNPTTANTSGYNVGWNTTWTFDGGNGLWVRASAQMIVGGTVTQNTNLIEYRTSITTAMNGNTNRQGNLVASARVWYNSYSHGCSQMNPNTFTATGYIK